MFNFIKIFIFRALMITVVVLLSLPVIGQKRINYFLNLNKYSLNGTFQKYHAALGSGDGILLRIELPIEIFKKRYTIDSFFIDKKFFPFSIIEINKKKFAEVNIFQNKKSISTDNADGVSDDFVDTMSVEKIKSNFVITKNGVRYKLFIKGYKQIEISNKY
jgi:hypothetical protein